MVKLWGSNLKTLLIQSQAEVGGEVVKIMVENGKPVVPGQVGWADAWMLLDF